MEKPHHVIESVLFWPLSENGPYETRYDTRYATRGMKQGMQHCMKQESKYETSMDMCVMGGHPLVTQRAIMKHV